MNSTYGRKIWPLLDSFQRTIIYLERTSTQWQLRTSPSAAPVAAWTKANNVDSVVVQGKGCMDDPNYNDSRVLVAFEPPNHDANWRVRGHVLASALPSSVVDSQGRGPRDPVYSTGCGGTASAGAHTVATGNFTPFTPSESFVGTDAVVRSYYTWNYRPNFGNAMYVAYNTTGIYAGGTVRAIIKAGADTAQIMDYFGYCDPNVPSGQNKPMGWWYANLHPNNQAALSRVYGWVPVRAC